MQTFQKQKTSSCLPHALAILFVPLIFILSLIVAYLGIFTFNVEAHTLLIVTFIFMIFAFFVKHNANYAVCHIKKSFGGMEQSLQEALRVNALTIMGKTKSTLHVHEFIEEYYKHIRSDNFAGVASSVFPMLGILGTFIAIALSMPDFSSKDTAGLDSDISLLLSGIGTAFYASIYGIMLSLIWTYFEKRGMSKIEKNIHDLEKIYGVRVWNKSELIKHQHMQNELKDQQIIDTLKETFNMDFIKELNEQYLKNFTTIMNETSSNFTQLTLHMQDASKKLDKTLKEINTEQNRVDASKLMSENIQGFNKNAQTLQRSLAKFDSSVETTFEKLDEELGNAVVKLSQFSNIISEQNQFILSSIAKMNNNESNKK